MEKYIHVDTKNRVCVVVLKDNYGCTVAKGISRCSEDDVFNEEAGLQLANARAWSKYYKSALKDEHEGLTVCQGLVNIWNDNVEKHKQNIEVLTQKAEALEKELADLLSSL